MPSYGTTTIWALRKLLGASAANDIDAGFAALADDTDGKLTPSTQGTLSAIPTAGKVGQTYKATDTRQLFRDNGTLWEEIPLVPLAAQTWQTIAFAVGTWSATARYYKDSLGHVTLEGAPITNNGSTVTATTTLFTLPAGYRPGVANYLAGSDGGGFARFSVDTNGDVKCWTNILNASAITFGFSWRAEN